MKWCTDWTMYEKEKGKTCTRKDLDDDLYYGKISKDEYSILSLQVPKPPKKVRNIRGKQKRPLSNERRKEIHKAERREEMRMVRHEHLRRSRNVSIGHKQG